MENQINQKKALSHQQVLSTNVITQISQTIIKVMKKQRKQLKDLYQQIIKYQKLKDSQIKIFIQSKNIKEFTLYVEALINNKKHQDQSTIKNFITLYYVLKFGYYQFVDSEYLNVFTQMLNSFLYFPYQGKNAIGIIKIIIHFLYQLKDHLKRQTLNSISEHLPIYYELLHQHILNQQSKLSVNGEIEKNLELQSFMTEQLSYHSILTFLRQLKDDIQEIYQILKKKKYLPITVLASNTQIAKNNNKQYIEKLQMDTLQPYFLRAFIKLNYPQIYLTFKALPCYIQKLSFLKKSVLNFARKAYIAIQKQIRLNTQIIKQLIFKEIINVVGQYQINSSILIDNQYQHPLRYLKIHHRQRINWKDNINLIEKSSSNLNYKLFEMIKMKDLSRQFQSILNKKTKQFSFNQIQLETGKILMFMIMKFPDEYLIETNFKFAMSILLTINEPQVVNWIFLHYIKFVILKRQFYKNNQQVSDILEDYFHYFIYKKIVTLEPKNNEIKNFQSTFLNAHDLFERLKKQANYNIQESRNRTYHPKYPIFSNQVCQNSNNCIFNIMKKDEKNYLHLQNLYQSYGSLKYSAYFLELAFYSFRDKGEQIPQILVNNAKRYYSKLLPSFSSCINSQINKSQNNEEKNAKQNNVKLAQNNKIKTKFMRKIHYFLKDYKNKSNQCNFKRILNFIFQYYKIKDAQDKEIIKQAFSKAQAIKLLFVKFQSKTEQQKKKEVLDIIEKCCSLIKNSNQRIDLLYICSLVHDDFKQFFQQRYYRELLKAGQIDRIQQEKTINIQIEKQSQSNLQILLHLCAQTLNQQFGLKIIKKIEQNNQKKKNNEKNYNLLSKAAYFKIYIKFKCSLKVQMNTIQDPFQKFCNFLEKSIKEGNSLTQQSFNDYIKILKIFFQINGKLKYFQYQKIEALSDKMVIYIQNFQNLEKRNKMLSLNFIYRVRIFMQITEANQAQQKQIKNNFMKTLKNRYDSSVFKSQIYYFVQSLQAKQQIKVNMSTQILIQIAKKYPGWSAWWVSGLINHKFHNGNIKQKQNLKNYFNKQTDNLIQFIGIQIFRKSNIPQQFINFVNQIRSCLHVQTKKKHPKKILRLKTPQGITDPFDDNKLLFGDFQVNLSGVGAGKSIPIRAEVSYKQLVKIKTQQENKKYKSHFILKFNFFQADYRIQSRSANFYKSLKIIDQQSTYNILHLSKFALIIQQLTQVSELQKIIFEQKQGIKLYYDSRQNQNKPIVEIFKQIYPSARAKFQKRIFNVHGIQTWWKRFNNYARTTAQWSYVGFITGLGDRHTANILMNKECKIAHIDFQYNLDYGKQLPFPEWVPFRLTKVIQQPFGILQSSGIFYAYFIEVVNQLRQKQNQFDQALTHFYIDQSSLQVIKRIKARAYFQKNNLPVYQNVKQIIQIAQSQNLLNDMFPGWRGWF